MDGYKGTASENDPEFKELLRDFVEVDSREASCNGFWIGKPAGKSPAWTGLRSFDMSVSDFVRYMNENFDNKTTAKILVRRGLLEEYKRYKGPVSMNKPAIAGVPITYRAGDKVATPDGRKGTIYGNIHMNNLLHRTVPIVGYFVCKVRIGDTYEYHVRQELESLDGRFQVLHAGIHYVGLAAVPAPI
ncbi:MAG: hypothetical protein J4F28_09110 [Nitrosopumilaceae archaeon]|nr:hypothetical protein [Nitrosopumilaceae archaeon]